MAFSTKEECKDAVEISPKQSERYVNWNGYITKRSNTKQQGQGIYIFGWNLISINHGLTVPRDERLLVESW